MTRWSAAEAFSGSYQNENKQEKKEVYLNYSLFFLFCLTVCHSF